MIPTPSESTQSCDIIISHMVQPQDANAAGNVHGGVIMKHIDNAAGVVAIRHARCNVVTASIDRLDFHKPAFVGNLLTFRGGLKSVGRTSMVIEVRADIEDLVTGRTDHTATATLTFVALDENGRPAPVPPLPEKTGP